MRMQFSMLSSIILLLIVLSFAVNAQSCHGGGGSTSDQMTPSENKTGEPTPHPTMQTICPVMGNSIDRTVLATWEGNDRFTPKRVYFCCPNCVKKFNKHPERYVKKLLKMDQVVENVFDEKKEEHQ